MEEVGQPNKYKTFIHKSIGHLFQHFNPEISTTHRRRLRVFGINVWFYDFVSPECQQLCRLSVLLWPKRIFFSFRSSRWIALPQSQPCSL